MKEGFFDLADKLFRELDTDELLLCSLAAERSDFVRFNHARVRQAGTVEQRYVTWKLVHAGRQASATLSVAGDGEDFSRARAALDRLRTTLAELPEDPWLLVSEDVTSTFSERHGRLPHPDEIVAAMTRSQHDLAGFYAGGTIYRGFANSRGQRNWHEADTFSIEWSLYLRADKAVKETYAGIEWDGAAFDVRLAASAERLGYLERPSRALQPGEYRVYLAPRAMEELMGLLAWGAFSAKERATRQTPLLKLEHGASLSRKVTIAEDAEHGIAPAFQLDGFVKPARVELIRAGALADTLVSPRSAREYGLATNAANAGEMPVALDMRGGTLRDADVLKRLDTGLYISNLWYLNYSDRPAGRITGMTRFATLWVQDGRVVGPVDAMRFDDTIYRMLGDNLVDLSETPEFMLDNWTYDQRSASSARLPGALLSALRFTL